MRAGSPQSNNEPVAGPAAEGPALWASQNLRRLALERAFDSIKGDALAAENRRLGANAWIVGAPAKAASALLAVFFRFDLVKGRVYVLLCAIELSPRSDRA